MASESCSCSIFVKAVSLVARIYVNTGTTAVLLRERVLGGRAVPISLIEP